VVKIISKPRSRIGNKKYYSKMKVEILKEKEVCPSIGLRIKYRDVWLNSSGGRVNCLKKI